MTRTTDELNDHDAARYLEDDERAPLPPRSIAEEDATLAAAALEAALLDPDFVPAHRPHAH